MRFADGTVYIGDWEEDITSGEGTMIGVNAVNYAGGWSKGLACSPLLLR